MVTQVSFTTDQVLKEKALAKAKQEGITLKTLFTYSMKAFVDGEIKLGIMSVEEEPEVEELFFNDEEFLLKARKLTDLLK